MANELQKAVTPINTLASYFDSHKAALAAILPKHMTAERVCRIVLSAASRTPKLLECTPESVYLACHSAAQLGLEPGGPLGHAYLVPFFNNKVNKMECQYIPGYKGLIELARRSGHISTIFSYTVHKDDKLELELGLEPKLKHVPSLTTTPNKENMTHVYACAHLTDGGRQFVVMTLPEVESIRSRSRAKESGPWVTDFMEMAKKTAVKRLVKMLPMSVELADAIAHEDEVEYGDLKDVTPRLQREKASINIEQLKPGTPDKPAELPPPDPAAKVASTASEQAAKEEAAKKKAEVAEAKKAADAKKAEKSKPKPPATEPDEPGSHDGELEV